MSLTSSRSPYPNPRDVTRCRAEDCQEEIVFLKTKSGSRIPVNARPSKKVSTDKWRPPFDGERDYVHGEHQPHHATCTNPDSFR